MGGARIKRVKRGLRSLALCVVLAGVVAAGGADAQSIGPSGCVANCGGAPSSGSSGESQSGGSVFQGPRQPSQRELDQQSDQQASLLNDRGMDAYDAKRYGEAFRTFLNAWQYAPNDAAIRDNVLAAVKADAAQAGRQAPPQSAYAECVRRIHRGLAVLQNEQFCFPGPMQRGRRSCGGCGRALFNDLAYGVPTTLQIRSYISQSQGKYRNCISRLGGACSMTCGGLLDQRLDVACSGF